MNTGNATATKRRADVQANDVRFERGRLIVVFSDDREVSVPLARYPSLLTATASQRIASAHPLLSETRVKREIRDMMWK